MLIIGNLHENPSSGAFLEKLVSMTQKESRKTIIISGDYPGSDPSMIWIPLRNLRSKNSATGRAIKFFLIQLYVSMLITRVALRFSVRNAIVIPPLLIPIIELKSILGVKAILYCGGGQSYDGKKLSERISSFFVRALPFGLIDILVVESESSISFQALSNYRKKISIIPQYVDTQVFDIFTRYSDRKKQIAFIGTLTESKGIVTLVKAVGFIASSLSEMGWSLIIVGNGPLWKEVNELILESNLEGIIFLQDYVPHSRVARILNDSRLLVLPSRLEGVPNIVLEAMSCGTPVLANPVGGIPDILKDGTNGFVIACDSVAELGSQILAVISSPMLETASEEARRTIRERFTYETASSRWAILLKEHDN